MMQTRIPKRYGRTSLRHGPVRQGSTAVTARSLAAQAQPRPTRPTQRVQANPVNFTRIPAQSQQRSASSSPQVCHPATTAPRPVQQQGRVKPTQHLHGVAINDDRSLEHEAQVMGKRARRQGHRAPTTPGVVDAIRSAASDPLPKPSRQLSGSQAPALSGVRGPSTAPIQAVWPFDGWSATDPHAPPGHIAGRVATMQQTLNQATPIAKANPEWYRDRQTELHAAEGEIHDWMRIHGHQATEHQRTTMMGYLNTLEDHHNALVNIQRQHDHPLWLPAGTSGNERQRANAVWNDVQHNRGNLKIHQSDPTFHTQALGDIAKLLQHQHGRDMLEELNADQGGQKNRQVRIGANWGPAFGNMNRRDYKPGSWATPTIAGTQKHRPRHTGVANVGMGSFVQIDRTQRQPLTGEHDDKEIAMPHYITLGHELGHALHNLRGTSATEAHAPNYTNLTSLEQQLWTKPEEHQNITQNENVIRHEHGLPRRAFHRPPQAVRTTRMKEDLENQIGQVRADFPEHDAELKKIDPFEPEFIEQPGINEPAFYEQAQHRINGLYRRRKIKRAKRAGMAALGSLAVLGAGYGAYRYVNTRR